MKKLIVIFILSVILVNCGGGASSSSDNNNVRETDLHQNSNAYTWVVGTPYAPSGESGAQFYTDLLNNLSPLQSNIPVSRILLSVDNPTQSPTEFGLGSSVALSGSAIQFLSQLALADTSSRVEVYILPYVGVNDTAGWGSWTPPAASPSISSCSAVSGTTDINQQNILKSICYAGLINQLISSESSSLVGINGVAYDGQSLALSDTDSNRAWLYGYTSTDNLKLGWLSSGMKSSVDLNLIEVYDLDKGASHAPRVDTIEQDSVYKVVTDLTPICSGEFCSYVGVFPGIQWALNTSGTPGSGTVGANIYQCAISNTESLQESNGCNSTYSDNINTESDPDQQMLQSFNYIYNNIAKTPLSPSKYGPIYGTEPAPVIESNALVYLFSTQYIGPVQSYDGSNKQCNEESGSCSCVASLYNSTASCGNENGFGSWANYLVQFKKFTREFLDSQSPCQAPGGCSAGIYMYDFIPQQWFSH